MLSLQNLKYATIAHASTTNGATASGTLDTIGFDEVVILVTVPTSDSTSNNPSVCEISEGDTTSSVAALTGGTGDSDFTIPVASTDTITRYAFHLTRGADWNKRYLKVAVSPTTTMVVNITGILGRAAEAPNSTTEQGTTLSVNI